MPNFTARLIVDESVNVSVFPWADPAFAAQYVNPPGVALAPSRINPRPEQLHTYYKVLSAGALLLFGATVGGVDRPLDSALGGNLFTWSFAEASGSLLITPTPSKSSEAAIFTPVGLAGHFLLNCTRANGGQVSIPFTLE